MPKTTDNKDTTKTADQLLEKATLAAAEFTQFTQEQTDRVVQAVFKAAFDSRIRLAKMAHEETGMGLWQHKAIKNTVASLLVYESIKNEKTVGVLSNDPDGGITELAQPLGPVLGIIPVTNPTATVIFKTLICLKSRNPIIISPSHKASACGLEAARVCYAAALKAGAPQGCVQCVQENSRELLQALMSHKKTALILATGGTSLVHAAYSSGTPAIGVGPGNVPVLVDASADIPLAVDSILQSKTFDNGVICASEQAVVVEKPVAAALRSEFKKQGAYFLSEEETRKVQDIAVDAETGMMSGLVVGQSVAEIARIAGISVPQGTKLLLAPLKGVGRDYPLSGEVLAPILAYYEAPDWRAAVNTCLSLNYMGGTGHTAVIYANDDKRVRQFAELMNAGRVLVNTPSAQGAGGGVFNRLHASLTLGCGAGGKNSTTENVTAKTLINIKRICRRRPDARWFAFDTERFLDEKLDSNAVEREYGRNY